MRLSKLFQKTALLLILLMSFHTIVAPLASAALVGTDTLISAQEVDASRARLAALLSREDVGSALLAHGVSAGEVLRRVNSLTDQEVMKLAQNIDALPAGADGGVGALVGAMLFIFLVLLFTDLLGLTVVYPFVINLSACLFFAGPCWGPRFFFSAAARPYRRAPIPLPLPSVWPFLTFPRMISSVVPPPWPWSWPIAVTPFPWRP